MKKKVVSKKSGSLADRALLVSISISQWVGRRVDQAATETANNAHSATSEAGKYHKKLLPGAKELGEISSIASQVRKYFYEQTLPWMNDGSRIIASKNFMEFSAQMRKFKSEFETASKSFVKEYPRLKLEAAKKLGGLYSAEEYPSDQEIGDRFGLDVTYLPLPDEKDFRTGISDNEKKIFLKKMREVENAAIKDCYERLHEVVKTAAAKLSSPNAIFRDTLIENINEIVNLLPKLNVSDDPGLEKMRREVSSIVKGITPDTLRENADERAKASKQLKEIEDRMGAFMGRLK